MRLPLLSQWQRNKVGVNGFSYLQTFHAFKVSMHAWKVSLGLSLKRFWRHPSNALQNCGVSAEHSLEFIIAATCCSQSATCAVTQDRQPHQNAGYVLQSMSLEQNYMAMEYQRWWALTSTVEHDQYTRLLTRLEDVFRVHALSQCRPQPYPGCTWRVGKLICPMCLHITSSSPTLVLLASTPLLLSSSPPLLSQIYRIIYKNL